LSREGQIVLAMSLVATILFVTEPIPLPTVPLLIIVGQIVLLGINPTKVAQSLMTDSVLFIMGSLMLAVAIVKQKLDKRVAWAIVRVTGTNAYWISFGITAVCGLIAAFIGEHTVAAMMLPVGVRLIMLTSNDPKKVHNLAAVILFSISYGCSIAGIATPSGGARNAIMLGYWQQIFFSPVDPETRRYLVDYLTWMLYAFPMFLLRLPIVTALLFFTFRPESSDMSRAVARLRTQVMMDGPMKLSDWRHLSRHDHRLDHALRYAGAWCDCPDGRFRVPDLRPGALGGHQPGRQLGRGAALRRRRLARRRDAGDGGGRMAGALRRERAPALRRRAGAWP
jgi:solute carrier family 13 (sodium-dependent dicarboxylate transporter), member 2/3/5